MANCQKNGLSRITSEFLYKYSRDQFRQYRVHFHIMWDDPFYDRKIQVRNKDLCSLHEAMEYITKVIGYYSDQPYIIKKISFTIRPL